MKKILKNTLVVLLTFTFCVSAFFFRPLPAKASSVNDGSVPEWFTLENITNFYLSQTGLASVQGNALKSFYYDPNFSTFKNAVDTTVAWIPGLGAFYLKDAFTSQFEVLDGVTQDQADIVLDGDNVQFNRDWVDRVSDNLGVDTSSPLDGVEVKTNFSDFNSYYDYNSLSSLYYEFNSSLKNDFLSLSNVFFQVNGIIGTSSNNSYPIKVNFFSLDSSKYDYFYFIEGTSTNGLYFTFYFHDLSNNNFRSINSLSIPSSSLIIRSDGSSVYYNHSSIYFNSILVPSFSDSHIQISDYSSGGSQYFNKDFPLSYYGTFPVVLASSSTAGQNYYYWMIGTPSGAYYTTNNFVDNNYTYNTNYVSNNWETAYNNYVTDVSNYYSTTENITNEQLTQYIDNSTTITNITNNYITSESGGEDEVITNSWLERIYNKLVEIKNSILGIDTDSDGDTYITDNSVKNDILVYPSSDLFPDLPVEDFIEKGEDFTIDLFASKLSAVVSEAIPFCYLGLLGIVATQLSANPTPPYWEIPFKINRLNIDESVVLDMTGSEWESVHNVWLILFMIVFVSFLFYLTYKVILLISNLFA